MSAGPFSLRDLLDHHELGLQLVTASSSAGARRISGVHTVEIDHPVRWLAPEWVMLTTGVRLAGDEVAQRTLVRELHDHGVSALGVGLGIAFEEPPEALLDEGRRLGFPVFTVPLETPFREVAAFVQRSLLSSEMRSLQRLSSIQRYLIDALRTPDPEPVLVERLASLLDGSAAVVRNDGRPRVASGALPEDLRDAFHDPVSGVREWRSPPWTVIAAPVLDEDDATEAPDWVVLATRTRAAAPRLGRAAVQATVPLVAAASRLAETKREQDRAIRRALLEELLRDGGTVDPAAGARIRALGVALEQPHRALVLRRPVALGDAGLAELEALLEAQGEVGLVAEDRGRVAVVLPGAPVPPSGISREEDAAPSPEVEPLLRDDDPAERLVVAVLEADPDVEVGLGRSFTGAAGIAASVRDAQVAVELVDHARRWRRFDDLDLTETVLAHVDRAAIAPKLEALGEVLDSRPGLRAAVRAWFDAELDVRAAAESLHLHPNSLRYRLSRLAEALDRPLRASSTIADLHLLLEAERRHAPDRE